MKNFLFSLAFLGCLSSPAAQQGTQQKGFDKKGQRHGRCDSYYNNDKKRPDTIGKYRHGQQTGKWKYFTADGVLYKEERHNLRKQRIQTRIYKNGKLLKTGKARIVDEPDGIHYYWYGPWKYYGEDGKLEKIIVYENGKAVNTILPANK